MNCEHCGMGLDGKQQKRFCSTECWYASRKWSREGMCAVCSNAFTKKFRAQICCSRECGNRYKSADRTQVCPVCGETFERPHGKSRTYCSRTCAMTGRNRQGQGKSHPEGTTINHSAGYIQQKRDGVWVMQHRLVMEQVIGRPLTPDERVHHRNGKRDDNRPENLELWTGVGSSKKDPHGVRLLDKVLDMIESLTEQERMKVRQRLEELAS